MWLNIGTSVLAIGMIVAVVISTTPGATPIPATSNPSVQASPARATPTPDYSQFASLTVRDLVAMSDAELEAMDPLVMNLVVARGLPDLADIDFTQYARIVDGWAERIAIGLARSEKEELTSPAYQADPDLWRVGGMAISLAGPQIGIAYTSEVNMSKHSDLFLPGLIDTRHGTCSNMPVLYMAIGHRLGWPLKAVVAADHMWCRWDDGKKRFNLEATTNQSDGQLGSFLTPPDESYQKDLNISARAIAVGSDMATLTARQTLGVYLQQRAAYWRENSKLRESEEDLLLASLCFPENREICQNLMDMVNARARHLFAPSELGRMFVSEDPTAARHRAIMEQRRQQLDEVNRINRENLERVQRFLQQFDNRSPDPSFHPHDQYGQPHHEPP